jgi:hypothetical protein
VNAAAVLVPVISGHQYVPGAYVNLFQQGTTVDSNGRSSNRLERVGYPFTVITPDTLTVPYEVRFDTTKYVLAIPGAVAELAPAVRVTFSPPAPARTPAAQPVLIRTTARRR